MRCQYPPGRPRHSRSAGAPTQLPGLLHGNARNARQGWSYVLSWAAIPPVVSRLHAPDGDLRVAQDTFQRSKLSTGTRHWFYHLDQSGKSHKEGGLTNYRSIHADPHIDGPVTARFQQMNALTDFVNKARQSTLSAFHKIPMHLRNYRQRDPARAKGLQR